MWEVCWDLHSLGAGTGQWGGHGLAESHFRERRVCGGHSTTDSCFVLAAFGSPGCPVPEQQAVRGSVPWVGAAYNKGSAAVPRTASGNFQSEISLSFRDSQDSPLHPCSVEPDSGN